MLLTTTLNVGFLAPFIVTTIISFGVWMIKRGMDKVRNEFESIKDSFKETKDREEKRGKELQDILTKIYKEMHDLSTSNELLKQQVAQLPELVFKVNDNTNRITVVETIIKTLKNGE